MEAMSTIFAKLTGSEFDAMVDRGAFDGLVSKKVELIRGELRFTNPAGRLISMRKQVSKSIGSSTCPRRASMSYQKAMVNRIEKSRSPSLLSSFRHHAYHQPNWI